MIGFMLGVTSGGVLGFTHKALNPRALTRSCTLTTRLGASDWWAAVLALGGLACSSNSDRGRPRYCRRSSDLNNLTLGCERCNFANDRRQLRRTADGDHAADVIAQAPVQNAPAVATAQNGQAARRVGARNRGNRLSPRQGWLAVGMLR